MKRRNLLKGLLGLPFLRTRRSRAEDQAISAVRNALDIQERVIRGNAPSAQNLTAMSFTIPQWAAPQLERDVLELEIQTLRKGRKS